MTCWAAAATPEATAAAALVWLQMRSPWLLQSLQLHGPMSFRCRLLGCHLQPACDGRERYVIPQPAQWESRGSRPQAEKMLLG